MVRPVMRRQLQAPRGGGVAWPWRGGAQRGESGLVRKQRRRESTDRALTLVSKEKKGKAG